MLLAPVTVGVVLAAVRAPALLPVVALAGLAGGAVVLGVGVRVAAAQLQRRGPGFVAALSPQVG